MGLLAATAIPGFADWVSNSQSCTPARNLASGVLRGERMSKRMMSIAELADYFHVSKTAMYRALKRELVERGFPAVRVGRMWAVDFDELTQWMCEQEAEQEKLQLVTHRKKFCAGG